MTDPSRNSHTGEVCAYVERTWGAAVGPAVRWPMRSLLAGA